MAERLRKGGRGKLRLVMSARVLGAGSLFVSAILGPALDLETTDSTEDV